MTEAHTDEFAGDGTNWGRNFIAAVLGLGIANGGLTLYGTADRYYGETAARDFEIRDGKIDRNAGDIKDLERTVNRIDESHPPPELLARVAALETEVWALKLRMAKNGVDLNNPQ